MIYAVYSIGNPDEGSGFIRFQHGLFKRSPQRIAHWSEWAPKRIVTIKPIRRPVTGRPLPIRNQFETIQTPNFNAIALG